jgi:hypothetical protein
VPPPRTPSVLWGPCDPGWPGRSWLQRRSALTPRAAGAGPRRGLGLGAAAPGSCRAGPGGRGVGAWAPRAVVVSHRAVCAPGISRSTLHSGLSAPRHGSRSCPWLHTLTAAHERAKRSALLPVDIPNSPVVPPLLRVFRWEGLQGSPVGAEPSRCKAIAHPPPRCFTASRRGWSEKLSSTFALLETLTKR